jgi:ornithine carbamoyltransferase
MQKDLISMLDIKDDLNEILNIASDLKLRWEKGEEFKPLKNMTLGMIFEKPSTRTRISFEVAMGRACTLSQSKGPADGKR